MKIIVLSDHYLHGGAAQATHRIGSSLKKNYDEGEAVIHHVAFFPDDPQMSGFVLQALLWYEESEAKRQLLRLPRKLLPSLFPRPHSPEFAEERLRKVLAKLQPDIIHVHNLHAAAPWGWGPRLVQVCLEFAPVVWTLHDMWSFTGRCAYSYDCTRFITGCDAACPTPHENPPLAPEKIHAAWEERRSIYARHHKDLVLATPSLWLAQQARRGLFSQHRIEVIPYGVPTHPDWFYPYPREYARHALGISSPGPVLLLAACDVTERRKGAEILPQLWPHLRHRPLTLATLGRGSICSDNSHISIHSLGWIEDCKRKALAYSAADALLHPAPVDNFPNVVLEAFACGTPAIGLPIGGLPEMIRPGLSGWLADSATPVALAQAIDRALGDVAGGKDLRTSCRALAEKEYSLELQGQRYFQLFKELLSR